MPTPSRQSSTVSTTSTPPTSITPPAAFGTTFPRKSATDVTSPSTRWISSPGVCRRWNSWSRPRTCRVMRSRRSFVVRQAAIVAWRATMTATTCVTTAMTRKTTASRDQFGGVGALGRPVDDLAHDERAGEHQQRAGRDERAEPDPTTSVGPEQGDQGAPAGGGRCRHRPSLLSPVRSRVMDSDTATPVATVEQPVDDDTLIEEELLVEEISIDGMCGVY